MAEPNDYITTTRKNFVTNNNEGRMVEKCIVKIQGAFLVKIRDYAFNGNIGENAFKHIDKFLKVVGTIKINGLTQDRFRLGIFPVSLIGATSKWFTKECIGSITTWDNMVERFIMKFHHLSDHDKEEETEEDDNPNETDNVLEIFKIEGNLFDFETPFFDNFHELDYDVLVKLQECCWKVNAHEIAPFTRMENFERGPYANMKTKWANNPYLDVNRIFGRDYEARNISDTQIKDMKNIRSEYLNHSKDSLDAYQELLRLIDEGWVMTTRDDE
ncbi:hypothetical protein Tco_0443500 [Tanacetum coccineum]